MVFLFAYGLSLYILESNDITNSRNFYGRLHVTETQSKLGGMVRSLMDGQITHGEQFLDPEYRTIPALYYGIESGVGIAVRHHNRMKGLRMGVIGLGTGAIAAYTGQGDTLRFYELNPAVEKIANDYFYYLKDCGADYDVILGDARISLERELKETGGQKFHILILDAFSNDTIPVHLMTQEAFSLYWKHLRPDGILVFHISNAYLDLSPVIRNLSQMFGKEAVSVVVEPNQFYQSKTSWILVTSNEQFLGNETLKKSFTPWPDDPPKKVVWTDDYSNLLLALK